MDSIGIAWVRHKEAVFWLREQSAATGVRAIPKKRSLKKMPVAGKRLQ